MRKFIFGLSLYLIAVQTWAGDSVGVLDFELYDHTPGSATEVHRTAGLRSALERELVALGYRLTHVSSEAQTAANKGFGYLWEHPDEAALLGKSAGADWVLVGRLHKPSALFAYVMVQAIDAKTGKVAGDLMVEIKGQQDVVTQKGITNLSQQINRLLEHAATRLP